MHPHNSLQLTAQFYEWEQRGRGWLLYDAPIDIEPPFHPFFFHAVRTPQAMDDGRRPTILSSIADFLKGKNNSAAVEEPEVTSIDPFVFENNEPLKVFKVTLPKGAEVDVETTEHLLLMLSYCRAPISFEIIASHTVVTFQIVTRLSDSLQVQSQLMAYFPECLIREETDQLDTILKDNAYASVIDFGLRDEFMRPVAMAENFNLDPFIGLFGALETMNEGEHVIIQVLFKGAVNPWAESIMRSVLDNQGDAFFMDAPDMIPLAKEKISYPLFGVTMKVAGVSDSIEGAQRLSDHTGNAFARIYTSPANSLIPLSSEGYDFERKVSDLLHRQSHRLGMLLNSRELATIVHLPSLSVISSKLKRDTRKTKAAPSIALGHDLVLGTNEHQGKEVKVSVSTEQRLKHTHLIGATGTGKSTMLLNLIVQDIQQGRSICAIDPHGDLIESIIAFISEERIEDVLIIDPADSDYPIGFNILQAHSEIEKEILSSDLVAGFRRLATSWGDQMGSVLANAVLSFLESSEGGTLVDLRRFLVEKSFRDSYLKTVSDPNVIYYWQKEYPLLRSNSIGSILTRLDTFLRPKLIRNMVAQRKSLDFEELLNTNKIILVKLSQGLIGTENSYLLGTVIVSKIHQAAMARQAKSKEERKDFFLYIDEFQNFITPSMSAILSGARKYNLGLMLAHQDMSQLVKQDSEIASSVMSNAGTRICFRIGDTDAKRFADGFSFFESEDLQNLNTGEAIARIERSEFDFSLTTEPLPPSSMSEVLRNQIISRSREKYGTPRQEIELLLKDSTRVIEIPEAPITFKKEIPPTPSEKKVETVQPPIVSIEETQRRQDETKEQLVKQKEQSQHRYLQNLIKRMAESRGFKTTLEEPTPDGKGRVDVSLERNGKRIAVEISVTTDILWEVHNIQKCLAAGFEKVVGISTEKKVIENFKKKLNQVIDEKNRERIMVLEPETFFQYLDQEMAKEATTEVRMKGYRVKVEYDPLSHNELKRKQTSIANVLLDSFKKNK